MSDIVQGSSICGRSHLDLTLSRRWAVALSTRSGPAYINYPMGRESVMTAVTWKTGEWPVFDPIKGKMSGWGFAHNDAPIPGFG